MARRVGVLRVDLWWRLAGLGAVRRRGDPKVKAERRLLRPGHPAFLADGDGAGPRHVEEEAVSQAAIGEGDGDVELSLLELQHLAVALQRHDALRPAGAAALGRPVALAQAVDALLLRVEDAVAFDPLNLAD